MNKNTQSKSKILFVANKCPHYRLPFFKQFAKDKVDFIFTEESKKQLPNSYLVKGFGVKKFKIHFWVVSFLFKKKYTKIVLLPPDPAQLLDNIVIALFCKLLRKPYIIWTERWDYKELQLKDKISNIFYYPIIAGADKLVAAGQKSKIFLKRNGGANKKIIVSPNASVIYYDRAEINYLKKEIQNKYSLKGKKIILYVGRIIKRKGLNYLIDAMAKISDKNIVLFIVGGGDFYNLGEKNRTNELQEQIKNQNLSSRIFMVGELENRLIPAYYELADIFVYPSITHKLGEAWGLAVNEAMQLGLPIVTTDAVGCGPDLVKNNYNGFIVPEKNSEYLKNAILKVLVKSKEMGENSKKVIADYTYEKMYSAFLLALQ